jgi:hypothetical protein
MEMYLHAVTFIIWCLCKHRGTSFSHKGPVLRPRCNRPRRARTQLLFYSILHLSYMKCFCVAVLCCSQHKLSLTQGGGLQCVVNRRQWHIATNWWRVRMLSLPVHTVLRDLSDLRLRKVRRGAWCLHLLPSWKQKVFLKHCCCSTRLHGVTYQMTVISLTLSDPTRCSKCSCIMRIIHRALWRCVSCYVAVYVASKLQLNVSSCLSLIWKMYKYMCQLMVIMRFVSRSGDGIENCVLGREALAWLVTARYVKSPVPYSTKVKDQCLWGWQCQVRQYLHSVKQHADIYWLLYLAQIIANTLVDMNVI